MLALVKRAFPDYRKRTVSVTTFPGERIINSYWDGGSRDDYAVVHIASGAVKPLPTATHPYFDVGARGMAGQQTSAFRSDHVGNIYLTHLPDGYALIRAGWFCGKPRQATVYFPQQPALPSGSVPLSLPA